MKGLCINLVKDHDYPPNYGIIFLQKKVIFEEKEHTLYCLVLNDDDDFMLPSPKGQTPFKIKKVHIENIL
jgi:hypothetical protein